MSEDQKFTDSQKTLTWSFPFCSQRTRSTRYNNKCLFKEITEKIEAFLGEINDNIDRHDGIWLTRFFVNLYMNENMSRVFKFAGSWMYLKVWPCVYKYVDNVVLFGLVWFLYDWVFKIWMKFKYIYIYIMAVWKYGINAIKVIKRK